jgi:hypothetical protein
MKLSLKLLVIAGGGVMATMIPASTAVANVNPNMLIEECYAECSRLYNINHDAPALARCDVWCDENARG